VFGQLAFWVVTMLVLTAGDWAAWFGAIGTVLAFSATSWIIWSTHRLRLIEHSEAMYDEALKVHVTVDLGAEYVTETKSDGSKEQVSQTKIFVTIINNGRRPISNFIVRVQDPCDYLIGDNFSEFLQAGMQQIVSLDPAEDTWRPYGTSPVPDLRVTLTFTDFDGTTWHRYADGRPVIVPRARRPWQRKGRAASKQIRALENRGSLGTVVVRAQSPTVAAATDAPGEGDSSEESP